MTEDAKIPSNIHRTGNFRVTHGRNKQRSLDTRSCFPGMAGEASNAVPASSPPRLPSSKESVRSPSCRTSQKEGTGEEVSIEHAVLGMSFHVNFSVLEEFKVLLSIHVFSRHTRVSKCCTCRFLNLVSTRFWCLLFFLRFPVPLLLPWCSMWVTIGHTVFC